jgi:single-stranded DNA-binding protein
MADEKQFKKSYRGDVFIVFEGTVGTEPKTNSFKTKNGSTLDVCSFRCVASPYRSGLTEPEDIWFTVRSVGSQQTKFAEQLQVGDTISVRGSFSFREFTTKAGKSGYDLVINADGSANSLRRVLGSKKPVSNDETTDTKQVATAASSNEQETPGLW